MKRLLALVVAVGLIVGAVIVRNVIDDDASAGGDDAAVRLVCAIELREACDALGDGYDLTVEDTAVTAERLVSTPDADVDVWVALDPWPAMVDDIRRRNGFTTLFHDTAAPVARSPLVAVVPDTLGECDWVCIAEGNQQVGSRALSSGIGLLHLGAATVAHFGTTDFATNDFDGGFRAWLAGLVGAVVESDEPVTRLLQSRAFFTLALSFEAEARPALDAAAENRKAGLALLYPPPVAHVDVVAVGTEASGDRAIAIVPKLSAFLVDTGWQPASGDPPGLPGAGVLVALRNEVR